jgi:hypothetical protein
MMGGCPGILSLPFVIPMIRVGSPGKVHPMRNKTSGTFESWASSQVLRGLAGFGFGSQENRLIDRELRDKVEIQNEWARDPSVRMMRKVFEKMEGAQSAILADLNVSPFDERVRLWRERALIIFERLWSYAMKKGISMDENEAAKMYVFSLTRVMGSDGIKIPERLLARQPDMSKLFEEAFR